MVIDLSGRYQEAFGLVTSATTGKRQLDFSRNGNTQIYVTGDASFEEIELYNDEHSLSFGSMISPTINGIGKVFAPPPLVSFSREKRFAVSTLDEEEGLMMVEKYGTAPWSITMQGLLVDMENHHYPSNQVRKISDVFKINSRFSVVGQIFDDLNISSLYFTNLQIQGLQGFADTMSYTLEARSIKDIIFELITE